ncbi:VC2046/SO_2500 family protein [Paraglaciecola arctica]|uniref:VC2046/SO_2500 family protein n=1 Tax=Paraglaciecola arctica TaxID=1128911 RepID=UPI00339D7BDA
MNTHLLDSVNTTQSDLNSSSEALLSSDYELNGTINRASRQGAKFALIMAMLEQDCSQRPHIEQNQQTNQSPEHLKDLNYYRPNPLKADDNYWHTCQNTSQLIDQGQIQSAHLWMAMHPEPLSQHNNAEVIDPEVVANCSFIAQARLQQAATNTLQVDETGLYDILQQLQPTSA